MKPNNSNCNFSYIVQIKFLVFSLFILVNVIKINAQNWDQILKVSSSENGTNDIFGRSVSISGDYAIIGAYGANKDTSDGNILSRAGAAYIFKNTNGIWKEVQKLVASDRDSWSFFGTSVSIDGDYAIIGAH